MSYTPTAAGHEDAPHEQPILVDSTRIDELVAECIARPQQIGPFMQRAQKPWTQEEVKRALCDPRFRAAYRVPPNADPSVLTAETVELAATMLKHTSDRVLVNDFTTDFTVETVGDFYAAMYDQSSRVLVQDMCGDFRRTRRNGFQTYNTLLLCKREPNALVDLAFRDTVVVNYTGARFQFPNDKENVPFTVFIDASKARHTRRAFEESTIPFPMANTAHTLRQNVLYIDVARACSGIKKLVLIKRENYPDGGCLLFPSIATLTFPSLPRLRSYVTELLVHCEDPHSLHSRYGPTPGPTIRDEIGTIVDEHFKTHYAKSRQGRRWPTYVPVEQYESDGYDMREDDREPFEGYGPKKRRQR